jgi:hypothetical protein
MIQRSNYSSFIKVAEVTWEGEAPQGAARRAFDDAVLMASPMDAFHTATVLRGKRVLMVQGSTDLAVPSPLGDVLWERAGRPERWIRDAGHEGVFMGMRVDGPRILEWIGAAVPRREGEGAGVP